MLFASNVSREVPVLRAVLPAPPPGPERAGGGGTTLGVLSVGEDDVTERVLVALDTPVEGGGATTLGASAGLVPLRGPRELPPAAPTVGGGGTTLAASKFPVAPLAMLE